MASATRDPAAQLELKEQQKREIEQRVGRIQEDVQELTDWKSRLRKDGPRVAAVGGAVVVLVVGSLVLRRTLRGRKQEAQRAVRDKGDIDALIAEIAELREEMRKSRKGGGGLAGKVAVAAVSAAASAAGKQAAGKLVDRQQERPAA